MGISRYGLSARKTSSYAGGWKRYKAYRSARLNSIWLTADWANFWRCVTSLVSRRLPRAWAGAAPLPGATLSSLIKENVTGSPKGWPSSPPKGGGGRAWPGARMGHGDWSFLIPTAGVVRWGSVLE